MVDSMDISVVIQGPIVRDRYKDEDISWTQKCIFQIRSLLPDAQIILSTWEGSDTSDLSYVDKLIKTEEIDAVYYDEFLGIYDNTNRQILTTLCGLNQSTKSFSLKIRTDTVLYSTKFLSYFEKYKSRNTEYSVFQSRIVASSVYAKKYAGSGDLVTKQLFQPSDIILFGRTDDLLNLYNIPLNSVDDSHFFKRISKPCFDAYTHMLSKYTPEQHIFISCLRKNNKNIYWPHRLYITDELEAESEKFICDNYTFVDQSNFTFEVKGHVNQKALDAFVWDGLYREKIWTQDYNKIYGESEQIFISTDEKHQASVFTQHNLKRLAKSSLKHSIVLVRLGLKIKAINTPYSLLNKNIHFLNAKARLKRRAIRIPNIGKQNERSVKDIKVITDLISLEKHYDSYNVVSFDIFDTLLRRYVEPVYIPLAQTGIFAEFLLKKEGINITSVLFNNIRQETVNEFYETHRRSGFEFEYRIHEVIVKILTKIGVNQLRVNDLAKLIVDNELKREIETLYVADGAQDLLFKIKASGRKIIAVSDMYFSSENINEILKAKGLLEFFDHVYVSSEFLLTKHSGRLFDLIKQDIPGKDIIHVGDNVNSDAIAPRRRGIKGIWLNDNRDMLRRLRIKNVDTNVSLLSGVIKNHLSKNDIYHDEISKSIFNKISYDFIAFAHHIIQYAFLNGIDRLYFLERDGSIFCDLINKLFHKIAMFDGLNLPVMEKVKMPRRVSAPLSDLSDPEKVIRRAYKVGIPDSFSLPFVLGAYGVSTENISELSLDGQKNVDIKDFIDGYETVYKPILIERRSEVVNSLSKLNFFEKGKIALIDIGWGGTSQKDIGSYILENKLDIECHGIYYGVDERTIELDNYFPVANNFFGQHDAATFSGSYSLIEFLIKNYAIDKNPKDVSKETLRINNLSREVLISSIDSYVELVNKYCLTASNVSSVTSKMASDFVNKPSSKFVKEIIGASFSLDRKENDEFVPLVEKIKLYPNFMTNIRRLSKNAQWIWGSLVYSKLSFVVKILKK
ncbi:HAD-IA family hydrolase [Kluyvera ascorbata]|uniref:HAD-IA family hydrolase n=1 Tax=Kluyvera ascorbata TaxID=51288 RepID=UPI0035CCF677